MGTQLALHQKGAETPQFSAHVCIQWPDSWMDQDAIWHRGRSRPRPHCARWGPSSPPSKVKRRRSPTISAHMLWPNGWMDQDPRPRRRCVRWGPSSPLKGARPPVFGSCLLWLNSWMDEDASWYGSRPQPRPHCARRSRNSPRKGHSSPLFLADVYCFTTVAYFSYIAELL